MKPKVSILWLNFNSYSFQEIVIESLQAVKDLEYPNYELIIVDNGSIDSSINSIRDFVEKSNIQHKIIQLDQNLGYTGGNNIGYHARDQASKYLVLLNNDAVPKRDSLSQLVDFMEKDASLGAAQGVITNYDGRSIDTAGDFLTELLDACPLLEGKDPLSLRKSVYITSADGAYSIYRIEFIQRMTCQTGNLFDEYLFAYYDDYLLGLRLWNNGFKVKGFPLITARHRRGTSFSELKQSRKIYLWMRNRIILNELSNNRYKILIRLLFLRGLFVYFFKNFLNMRFISKNTSVPRAFIDGIRMVGDARKSTGEIDIYSAPILRITPLRAIHAILTRPRSIQTDRTIQKELETIAGS